MPSAKSQPPFGRLKVCIATRAPFVGGAEIAAERLALGLQEAGHNAFVVVGTEGPVMERMMRAGLRCVWSPMYCTNKWHWWRYEKARYALHRLLRQERPDVIHSNDLPTHQIVSDAARGIGVPRICHHRFSFGGACIDWLNKFGAEAHLFVSDALRRQMCANSTRLAGANHAVVHDGLQLPTLPTELARQQARARLSLPGDKTIVLFTGQIIKRKGVADLLHAWTLIDARLRRDAELVLAGDDSLGKGAYRAAMETLAGNLKCAARFVGFQKNVEEWQLASNIVVMPSLEEPLGFAIMEGMAYALPVIGCAVGGIPEMVEHDRTGLLVPPGSAESLAASLSRLLADSSLRLRYGQLGRQRCEDRFNLQTHVRSVLEEYDRVLRPSRRVAA